MVSSENERKFLTGRRNLLCGVNNVHEGRLLEVSGGQRVDEDVASSLVSRNEAGNLGDDAVLSINVLIFILHQETLALLNINSSDARV